MKLLKVTIALSRPANDLIRVYEYEAEETDKTYRYNDHIVKKEKLCVPQTKTNLSPGFISFYCHCLPESLNYAKGRLITEARLTASKNFELSKAELETLSEYIDLEIERVQDAISQ